MLRPRDKPMGPQHRYLEVGGAPRAFARNCSDIWVKSKVSKARDGGLRGSQGGEDLGHERRTFCCGGWNSHHPGIRKP